MIVDKIVEDFKRNPIHRDTDISINNDVSDNPGEPTFEYPKNKEGKDKIFNSSVERGYTGSRVHPRG
jgi:hypothetical protein